MIKRTVIIILILLLILAGVWYFLFRNTTSQSLPSSSISNQNPFGAPSGNTVTVNPGNSSTTEKSIQLQTNTDQTVTIPDFTISKTSFTIGAHQFYYLTSNQETQGANAQFDIIYGTDSSISIGLLKEPLGQSRLAAEAELRKLIPLSDSELCTLKVTVEVPYQVSQLYPGQNLGLSFCPGATELPQ